MYQVVRKLGRTFSTTAANAKLNNMLYTPLSATVIRADCSNSIPNENKEIFFPNRKNFRGPLSAAILDWSGTTVDMHVLAPAVVFYEVFAKHNVPITMNEAREPMGLRKDLHIAKILNIPEVKKRWIDIKGYEPNQETVDQLFKDFVPMQLEVLPKYTDLLPGCAECTQLLRSKYGLKLGSTTGFIECMVEILVADAEKQGFTLDCWVAGDTVPNNLGFRPAPFMVYQNLLHLGVWPIEAVVKVDDTVSGIGEGLNAGCWTVGIYGYSNYTNIDSLEQWSVMTSNEKIERQILSKEKLMTSGAHYIVENISDLPECVEDINYRLSMGENPMANNTTSTTTNIKKDFTS